MSGLEHSLAAADVAAYIGKACNAEVVLFNVAHTRLAPMFWKEREHRDQLQSGYTVVREAEFRVARLGAWMSTRVRLGYVSCFIYLSLPPIACQIGQLLTPLWHHILQRL